MNLTILFLTKGKLSNQSRRKKKPPEFKPVKLCLKTNLVSHTTGAGVDIYIYIYIYIYMYIL